MNPLSRIRQVESILLQYKQMADQDHGTMPLSVFLSNYYRANKQMGSKDRKIVSELLYNYFRLGNNLNSYSFQDSLLISNFLCQSQNQSLFSSVLQGSVFENKLELSLAEKVDLIGHFYTGFQMSRFLAFDTELSGKIEQSDYNRSFFQKPLLWIRLKRGKEKIVKQELNEKNIAYKEYSEFPNALSFLNGTSLEDLRSKKMGYFEIQDLSSQQTGVFYGAKANELWWDCCAASGGKSLLLADSYSGVNIVASDTREGILVNLKNRFNTAGMSNYQIIKANLLDKFDINKKHDCFDGIIADVPCSGSGTWSRTPEMLSFFTPEKLLDYQKKQKQIVINVLPYLKKGQALIYITCSVFKAENEDVVDYVSEKCNLKIESMQVINGLSRKSDSMFLARLIK